MKFRRLVLVIIAAAFLTNGPSAGQVNLEWGLVGCYPFSGNAEDASGNNHHGTVNEASLTTDRFGNANSAYSFDGINDNIDLGLVSQLWQGDELTVSLWIQTDAVGHQAVMVVNPDILSDRFCPQIYYNHNGASSTFWDYGSIFSGGRVASIGTVFSSQWENYILVTSFQQKIQRVYKNGVLQTGDATVSKIVNRNRNLYLGGGFDSGNFPFFFDGKIDDVRIYDRVLSPDEIAVIQNLPACELMVNTISGTLFFDYNKNGIRESWEDPLVNWLVTESNSGKFAFSNSDGEYALGVPSAGSFVVTTGAYGAYSPVPATHSAIFTGIEQADSLNDFAFQAPVINDLRVSVSPAGVFRSGFNSHYVIKYTNKGTAPISPTVVFLKDASLQYVSATLTPASVTTDSVVWTPGLVNPSQSGVIKVKVYIPPSVQAGTPLHPAASVYPVAGDAYPLDNFDTWNHVVTASYDPNRIYVDRDTVWSTELINPPYLNYLIAFQNTGNDTAVHVDIINRIPSGLSMQSFELIDASHPVAVRYIAESHSVGFKFADILLPDSGTSESLSHGFIRYLLKPYASLAVNDSILNRAGIYFDFNPPILTNYAVTVIGYQPSPLPVTLMSFTAVQVAGHVDLKWTTSSEINNARFDVERASDPEHYMTIGTVQGMGTTATPHHYAWTDADPVPGFMYYRLKQIDFDGNTTCYGPVRVHFRTKTGFEILSVYSVASGKVRIMFTCDGDEPVSYRIVNILQQPVLEARFPEVSPGLNQIELQLNAGQGIYLFVMERASQRAARLFHNPSY